MEKLTKEMEFFIYLLENYASHKKVTADKVLERWDNHQITDLIYHMYTKYHSEAIENAYADIDRLILERS